MTVCKKDWLLPKNYYKYHSKELYIKSKLNNIIFNKNIIEFENYKKERNNIYSSHLNFNGGFRKLLLDCGIGNQILKLFLVGGVGTFKSAFFRNLMYILEYYVLKYGNKFEFNTNHICFDNKDLYTKIVKYIKDNENDFKKGNYNKVTLFIRDETRKVLGMDSYFYEQELNAIQDMMRQYKINVFMIKPTADRGIEDIFDYEYILKVAGYDKIKKFFYVYISEKNSLIWQRNLIIKNIIFGNKEAEKLYKDYEKIKKEYLLKTAKSEIGGGIDYYKILVELHKFGIFKNNKPIKNNSFYAKLESLNKQLSVNQREILLAKYKLIYDDSIELYQFQDYCNTHEYNIVIPIKIKLTQYM